MPGDVIAYTGTSGVKNGICSEDVFINAAHLHVSVLKYDKELVCSDCLYKVQRGGTTEPSFKWKIELNYVDPFDYERPYKGLVSIPGRE